MGFPRLGFLGAMGAILLGALGLGASAPRNVPGGALTPDYGNSIPAAAAGRGYGSRPPGERAHRRWRKARSSGRHDFRRTLKRKAA